MENLIDLKIILGFLSGSLGTIFLKEIFNLINKKVDFNRELRKHTYTKKLETAEKAVGFYSVYINSLIEIKKSYEVILKSLKEDRKFDLSVIGEVLNKSSVNITELMRNSYSESASVHLYFELVDLDKWNENDISDFLESLTETKSKDSEIQSWLTLYQTHINKGEKENADFCWRKIEEILPEYTRTLEKVVYSLEKNREASYNMIKKIKQQL